MYSNKPLKIFHLLNQRPDSTGSGIYIQAMIREAYKKGYENYLLAGIPKNDFPNLDFIKPENCSFVQFGKDLPFPIVGMSDVMPYKSTRFRDLSETQLELYEQVFSQKLKKMVENNQPDIIHSHHLWLVTSFARKLFPNIPIVTSCHGSDLRQFQNMQSIANKVVNYSQNLNGVFALSKIQKKEIAELYKISQKQIHIIGAGYHRNLFYFSKKAKPDPIQIVYAGKLSRAKGVPWLLRALSEIKKPDWQLHLIGGGTGPEKEECLTLTQQLGDRVKVYGALPQQELASIFKQSHLFALPSLFEGVPLVLIEALACGCRLISTKLPGVSDVLRNIDKEYLQLVELPRLRNLDQPFPEDEKIFEKNLKLALINQMVQIKRKPQTDQSKIKPILENFTWERVFKRIEDIYFEVLP